MSRSRSLFPSTIERNLPMTFEIYHHYFSSVAGCWKQIKIVYVSEKAELVEGMNWSHWEWEEMIEAFTHRWVMKISKLSQKQRPMTAVGPNSQRILSNKWYQPYLTRSKWRRMKVQIYYQKSWLLLKVYVNFFFYFSL